jgi:hypothetical protein
MMVLCRAHKIPGYCIAETLFARPFFLPSPLFFFFKIVCFAQGGVGEWDVLPRWVGLLVLQGADAKNAYED